MTHLIRFVSLLCTSIFLDRLLTTLLNLGCVNYVLTMDPLPRTYSSTLMTAASLLVLIKNAG
jgi:hypothetical protein